MPDYQQQTRYFAGEVALWVQRGCGEELEFLGCHNVTGVSVPRGDSTPQYCRIGKNTFKVDRSLRGAPGLGSMTIITPETVTNLLQELPCPFNLYVLFSACGADEDPTQWDFLHIYNDVEPNSEDTDTLHVGIDPGENATIMLSLPSSFTSRLKVKRLFAQVRDVSDITTYDINDVSSCDAIECSDLCGATSIGCQVIYFVTDGNGVAAVIGKSTDGGTTWTTIVSPFTDATDDIVTVACDGDTVLVASNGDSVYAYSWDAGATWTEVFTPTWMVNDIFMLGATRIWMACQNGYIYYSNDRGASVTLQDAGVATTQSLNSISFADKNRGYAVGDNNAFVYTRDGGDTWVAATGPAPGIFPNDLYVVVAVPDSDILFVGDEQGNVYRSTDYGQNWTTSFTATAATAGGIADIALCDCNVVAFVANDQDPYFYSGTSVDGVMYQSIDGGVNWTGIAVPDNDGLNSLICCDVNQYWYTGENGVIGKAAGPT
jgi:hypothetical protein